DVALTFPVETARRIEGKLPAGFDRLGLHQVAATGKRDGKFRSLWLDPIGVRLVRANWAARLTTSITDDGRVQLASAVIEPGKTTPAASENLTAKEDPAVYPYQWQTTAEGKTFTAQGFVYLESIAATLAEARKMATRSTALGSTKLAAAPSAEQIAALEAEARQTSPADRSAWRKLHNRARELRARLHLSMLDAPLLLVKQHPYFAAHIYDDYYTWHPGGGIYVLEEPFNPQPGAEPRAVIDSATNQTLGAGVYRDAELHWDAGRLLFAYKPDQSAMTSIYEIGVDGQGLRRLTASDKYHDITPAYLPDDRIVFTSTRPRALVPCFNSGVDTLHTMNGDGSDIQPISTNNVTEFDPAVLPDGRVVYGRWEYVDKTALYMQSLWTMLPDGRMEEALFANNLAKPTAVLDVQAVPHQQMVVASLTPHNGQAVGAIGMIDMTMGKNDLGAVFNFTPEYPIEMDQGLRVAPCDPWALSADDVLMSNNAISGHGIIELVDRRGNRELVYADVEISCFAPSPVKPRPRPTTVSPNPGREEPGKQQPGRFLLVDVYEGLEGVERGQIKQLRVVEETARISGLPPGGRWWNQAFLVSWQGAYIVKNILGVVPVEPDGSAYFEVPAGRAVYFEALDAEGREVQRMRTFVQAAPGVTRSCVGCHEDKKSAPLRPGSLPMAVLGEPVAP
ncbi:MAG: PD40 domain-containing protein, partial [Planctomycetes bacterium]|nr:PD40 domain-containing protein [Planctomycetota bacterium]